jgi:surface carbohydrate biosynthesis protein (TIGR04326 family)
MKGFRARRRGLARAEYLIVSYFPLVNKEAAKESIFENGYLGSFHKELRENHEGKYSHILINIKTCKSNLKDSITLAKSFTEKQSLFFIEEFLKPAHFVRYLFYYIYFSAIFIFNIGSIRKKAVYNYQAQEYDVWDILKPDFYSSFCGPNLASSILYTLLFEELSKDFISSMKILSVCEMQGWERALYIFAKKSKATAIGYQHTILPELLLNYFNAPEEVNGGNPADRCPLPDYMATVGDISAGLLRKYSWPEDRVFVWGAQRFSSLIGAGPADIPWERRKDCIVVAFSIDKIETENIIRLLSMAFKGKRNYKIVLKGHLTQDIRKIVGGMDVKLDSGIFEYADESLVDIIRYSKGMIVTESSSCFYAAAYGLPIIVPRFSGMLDLSPLAYITDIPRYVYSPEDLVMACEGAISSRPSVDYQNRCSKVFNDYLHFPKNDTEYADKIFLQNV